jgi:hypothetical protein
MCKRIVYLIIPIFVLTICGIAQAGIFTDNFDTPHDYLISGVQRTGWDGFIGKDPGEIITVLNASGERPGELYIESESPSYWEPPFDPLGPFLYKMVKGDFIATVHIIDFPGLNGTDVIYHNDSFIMARVPNLDDAGDGEDFECSHYFPTWNGNIRRSMDNGNETEGGSTADGFACDTYIQLERRGNDFYYRHSPDGVTWTDISGSPRTRTDMEGLALQVGLAQCTYGGDGNGYVVFDDFRLEGPLVKELIPLGTAYDPSPSDENPDVVHDVVLNWTPGTYANTHNLFIGTDINDVNDATVESPLGATAQEGLDVNNYDIGRLEFDTTYYWRVDEVNSPSTPGTYKGLVWSFKVEPVAIKVPASDITATASTSYGTDPNDTINESGLDPDNMDLHSSIQADMWLSVPGAPNSVWIRFDFEKVYKLHQVFVWNYNYAGTLLNAGFKDVIVEYSQDGQTWTEVPDVPQFAKGTGKNGYKYNTVVDLGDVVATSVRLRQQTNWGMPVSGLSEVAFTYIPVWARNPKPENEAVDVPLDVTLTWYPGREAGEHKVYISTDETAVTEGTADTQTVTGPVDGPLSLDLNRTYYWRVDEVNNGEVPAVWSGDVWSFSTIESFIVDDFEDYNDTQPYTVWDTWIDGLTDSTYGGSRMGNEYEPFCEETIVHGGSQSAPLTYNNTSATKSEAVANTANLAIGSDWSVGNPDTLVIWFRGDPNNLATDQLYVKLNSTKVLYEGDVSDISGTTWKKWQIDITSLSGLNLSNVTSITIGLERIGATGDSGVLYLDDIQLTSSEPVESGAVVIVNPSFEDDGTSDGTPSGWSGNDVSGGSGSSSGEAVSATDGDYYLWQGNGNITYQTTNEVIASPGLIYKLQVDVRNSWNASPKIIIYYEDAGQRIELGSTTMPSNGSSWPNPITMEVMAITTAESVGKKLGVELTIDNYPGDRWAHYDNVRFYVIE